MITWWRKLKSIVQNYEAEQNRLRKHILGLEEELRNKTDIGIDVGFCKDQNYVIMVGRFKTLDYVQTYSLAAEDFAAMVEHCKHLQQRGVIRYVDAPPVFRAIVSRGLKGL